jgi:hypothetical protein
MIYHSGTLLGNCQPEFQWKRGAFRVLYYQVFRFLIRVFYRFEICELVILSELLNGGYSRYATHIEAAVALVAGWALTLSLITVVIITRSIRMEWSVRFYVHRHQEHG